MQGVPNGLNRFFPLDDTFESRIYAMYSPSPLISLCCLVKLANIISVLTTNNNPNFDFDMAKPVKRPTSQHDWHFTQHLSSLRSKRRYMFGNGNRVLHTNNTHFTWMAHVPRWHNCFVQQQFFFFFVCIRARAKKSQRAHLDSECWALRDATGVNKRSRCDNKQWTGWDACQWQCRQRIAGLR